MSKIDDKQVRCSFCGKREGQVKRLIAGPGVFICDECIDLCCDILHDDFIENEMEDFDDDLGNSKFDNFNFVNFQKVVEGPRVENQEIAQPAAYLYE